VSLLAEAVVIRRTSGTDAARAHGYGVCKGAVLPLGGARTGTARAGTARPRGSRA
jgi:hypothetical protein